MRLSLGRGSGLLQIGLGGIRLHLGCLLATWACPPEVRALETPEFSGSWHCTFPSCWPSEERTKPSLVSPLIVRHLLWSLLLLWHKATLDCKAFSPQLQRSLNCKAVELSHTAVTGPECRKSLYDGPSSGAELAAASSCSLAWEHKTSAGHVVS